MRRLALSLLLAACSTEGSVAETTADVATIGDTASSQDTGAPGASADAESPADAPDPGSDDDVGDLGDAPGDASEPDDVALPSYPMDDTLRVNHLQCLGTHNSYHVEQPGNELIDWAYTMPPLQEQLETFGARHFEIDSYPETDPIAFPVVHLPIIDPLSTCDSLQTCFGEIAAWSDTHRDHHPLFVMLELKSTIDVELWIDALDDVVVQAFGEDRVVTPDEVRGTAATLREAVTTAGWPTLGQTRGRVFVIVMEDDDFYAAWTNGHPGGAGRKVFVHQPPESPDAAFVKLDGATDTAAIEAAVTAGFIVRTRSDSISDDPGPDGTYDREVALSGGAHMVSTDFLAPRKGGTYSVSIPGGTPSRCNPINAPEGCTSQAIEDSP